MSAEMRVQAGGEGEPVLLLVHGLGATGDVWNRWPPLLAERWPGRWLAPDLPGHGGSDALPGYSFGALAASLAGIVDGPERLVVLGHSLGGVLGLTLASGWFGVHVESVVGLGIKVAWTADELDKAGALALRPVSWYASREAAAERYLRVSGLAGLLGADDDAVGAGVREEAGQWRLAMDPSVFSVGEPDMRGLVRAARSTVVLARGEHDPMVTDDQLAIPGSTRVTLPGLGHNAHVEDPAATMALLEPYLR
ncbi:MAG TPA: alpha/beta fold hydrolase [Jiangellaceae bacterium]|nr:alpha/beta fold hydrolase [Jiangellaceae bacterium]